MEPNKKIGTIVIVMVSALFTFFNPVESECVPLANSYVARSLLPIFPPSNTASPPSPPPSPKIPAPVTASQTVVPSRKESPGPAPAGITAPTNNPTTENKPLIPLPKLPMVPLPKLPLVPLPKLPLIAPGLIQNLTQKLLPPGIKDVCAKTDFPSLCESSIQPLATGQIKTDPESMLLIAIQASIDATKTGLAAVGKIPDAADCVELYDSAVTNLETAVTAVKSRDPDTANSNLSAAMTDYSTCNDGFEETGEPNPLADVGDKLMKMASNCLAISSLVK